MSVRFTVPRSLAEQHELQRGTTQLLSEHETKLASNRLRASGVDPNRYTNDAERAAAAVKPASATVARYLKRGHRMYTDAVFFGDPLWDLVEARSNTAGSWYTCKAATQHYLVHELRSAKKLIRAIDMAANVGPISAVQEEQRTQAFRALAYFGNALDAMPKSGLPFKFNSDGKSKRGRFSKSASLRGLPVDWREKMAGAMPPMLRRLWLLQCVTGCRPSELKNGAEVSLRPDGSLHTVVRGAKVRAHAGQPRREMLVSPTSGVAQLLALELVEGKPAGANWMTGSVDAYRKSISRIGAKVFPGRVARTRVTAYSARHQFKADARAANFDAQQVAKAMGHVSTRSAVHYGGVRAGRDGVTPTQVRATREVRARPAFVPQPAPASVANAVPSARHRSSASRKP